MKKKTKREKRRRRKLRKQALERCILRTEALLAGEKKEQTWQFRADDGRTVTLPPPVPGRQIVIKNQAKVPLTVEVPGMGKIGPFVSGSEPMSEEQFNEMLKSLLG